MSVQIVRFRTTPEKVPAVTEEIEAVFAAVKAVAPQGMRYTALRETDEPEFTLILELPDGADNPLPSIPAAAAFRGWLPDQTDDNPAPRSCTVVGRYSA
ncbi:hypothetical protein BAY61_23660 [Prauserella marina]|uniref:Uncharacterized protein n=1 Tax=Prauserella marina TaxID=530584 RepID=A0A222VUC8_9PSEU|nr:hypothetical protein [Prauserella marina]ASR37500.1 hypothetical protein BAY61_23660 [Prauserella marina]PWV75388.1 hypothetical protein DES30_1063 [Prauserella marina]SDD35740.1 hypothetical protein SAMN05421630_107437 [Prauserella marina]